jgi:hypothetical protein
MYESIEGAAACFRRLNGTHQFGCSCKERRLSKSFVRLLNVSQLRISIGLFFNRAFSFFFVEFGRNGYWRL